VTVPFAAIVHVATLVPHEPQVGEAPALAAAIKPYPDRQLVTVTVLFAATVHVAALETPQAVQTACVWPVGVCNPYPLLQPVTVVEAATHEAALVLEPVVVAVHETQVLAPAVVICKAYNAEHVPNVTAVAEVAVQVAAFATPPVVAVAQLTHDGVVPASKAYPALHDVTVTAAAPVAVQPAALASAPVTPEAALHCTHLPEYKAYLGAHDVTVTAVALVAVQVPALLSAPVVPVAHETHVLAVAPPGAHKA